AARHDIDLDAITRLSHGTTVATNALIQRRGGKVALVVTEGFRDLIEIGRQIRPHVFSLQQYYPAPLVTRELRFEAGERITADGKAIRAVRSKEASRTLTSIGFGLGLVVLLVRPGQQAESQTAGFTSRSRTGRRPTGPVR